ncbi:membrane protease YdiL (CAAX protease family) [Pseudoclavibacter chungangensis]|nr:type II CAAX endopeptidase family protein [Pseudoclavibacter chungangensis]NYJ66204.1 membrane protease YdiL (CAAX protease family) [Pseudoclavibacter chungangensis]
MSDHGTSHTDAARAHSVPLAGPAGRPRPAPGHDAATTDLATRRVRFWRHPVTVAVSSVLTLVVMIPAGMLAQFLLAPLAGDDLTPVTASFLAFGIAVPMCATAILVVFLLRRLARLPFRTIGILPVSRLWLVVPAALAAFAIVAASALVGQVLAGGAWGFTAPETVGPGELTLLLVLSCVYALCSQAFPEELVFRGHLMSALRGRMPAWGVIVLSSLLFGVLHLVSQSSAEGAWERSLYALAAGAFGFAAAAFFHVTGSVWGSVGIHWGLHIGLRLVPFEANDDGTVLLSQILGFVLVGVAVLRLGRRRERGAVRATSGAPIEN